MIRSVREKMQPLAALADAGPLELGARFLHKYEICEQIGHGAQAWVYRGRHTFTAREVAIKVIHSPYGMTREMLERGKSEARALGKLDHPSIVVMHDAGVTDEGLFYIVMELLRGRSLRAALTALGRLGVEELLRLAIQAGEALQVAHEVGLIHRDLKPDNIYLTRDNRLKVLDFGIAKMLNEIGFTTKKDVVVGSLLYMSPEQIQGLPLTPRSDICALGLMMFEALLGKHPSLFVFERDLSQRSEPYRRATLADVPAIQVNRVPPLLSDLDPRIPGQVAELVQRAIAKLAADRFATMSDFVSAMRSCLATVGGVAPSKPHGAADRDLSLPGPGAAQEPPASQRATSSWKLGREGADCPAPPALLAPTRAPALVEPREARLGLPTMPIACDSQLSPSTLAVDGTATRARANTRLRNAIIGACLFGAALGSAGALTYLGAAHRAALPARAELDAGGATVSHHSLATPRSLVAPLGASESARVFEPQPELEPPPVVAVKRAASAPASTGPALHGKRGPPGRTAVSARSGDKIADRTLAIESDFGSDRSKDPMPSASGPVTKHGSGRKPIYGD